MPVAHGEGNYVADEETIARLEGEGRVAFRYAAPDGRLDPHWNVNGSTNAIAGILNERGNVLGMMPHPENHVEAPIGSTDGRGLFAGPADHFKQAAQLPGGVRDGGWFPRQAGLLGRCHISKLC